jgi:type IV secretion system protein VirB8
MAQAKALDVNAAITRLPQAFAEAAADFETFKITEIKKSRKVAWIVAGTATAMAALATVAFLVAMLSRVEPEPVVITVEKSTGITNTVRMMKDAKDQYGEVVDKYWVAKFVSFYEGYDWYTISNQFEAVKLMSENDVAAEYGRKVQAPTAPLAMLKDKGKIAVDVSSVVFVGDVAQVRFSTTKVNTSGENTDASPQQRWIATVAYKYSPSTAMSEQQRLVNPLGLKILTYRADPEVTK